VKEPNLDAIEADVRTRIEELQGERQRLSLDSLSHGEARQEWAAVSSELDEAQAELRRVELARTEAGLRRAGAATPGLVRRFPTWSVKPTTNV